MPADIAAARRQLADLLAKHKASMAGRNTEIVRLAVSGSTVREIADALAVSRGTVYHVLENEGYERAWIWRKKETQ